MPICMDKIMGVSMSAFYRNAQNGAADHAAQHHGNTSLHKPESHIVVATTTLGAILGRHANHMPYKSCMLPPSDKVVAKVLPARWKWKDQKPAS